MDMVASPNRSSQYSADEKRQNHSSMMERNRMGSACWNYRSAKDNEKNEKRERNVIILSSHYLL